MKVLIVEDSSVTRHLLEQFCLSMGYEVDTAVDGVAALTIFDNHPIVLMDLHLPKLDGWDTAAAILQRAPRTYIIACTSNRSGDHQAYSLEVGMREFLVKPPDVQALREALLRGEKFSG